MEVCVLFLDFTSLEVIGQSISRDFPISVYSVYLITKSFVLPYNTCVFLDTNRASSTKFWPNCCLRVVTDA